MKTTTPLPSYEELRLKKLYSYQILDSPPEAQFDDISQLVALICDTPIGIISLVDKDRVWFKSKFGIDANEVERNHSFCHECIQNKEIFEIEDTLLNPIFKHHALVINPPHFRFYAGYPLIDDDGFLMGTLCVIHHQPHKLTETQKTTLKKLSDTVVRLIQWRTSSLNLQVKAKRLDLIISGSNFGTWEWNVQTNEAYFNERWAQILGYTLSELEPIDIHTWTKFIHPEDSKIRDKILHNHWNNQSNFYNCDFRIKQKNGTWVWVRSRGKTISWTSQKKPLWMYGILEVITEQKEMELKLKQAKTTAEKALQTTEVFLANVSHEIRTPLNSITGFSNLLKEKKLAPKDLYYVKAISSASKNLTFLINNILNIAKIEDGVIKLENKVFSINDTLEEVFQINSEYAQNKGLQFITNIDPSIPEFVIGDATSINQILVNLVNNAVKFTEKGYIQISAKAQQQSTDSITVYYSVRDTGVGIRQEHIEHIFNRFTQFKNDSSIHNGTGLGLNICKMLIDLHNSSIGITSEVGVGSNFFFEITYSLPSPQSIQDAQVKEKNTISLQNINILLVEDNEHNQIISKAYLVRNNAQVDIANNGAIALELLAKKEYSCILLDLQMPILDGYQTAKIIRNELHLKIPIIALTAHSLNQEKEKCFDIGMNAYITKPFIEQELIETIFYHCHSHNHQPNLDSDSSQYLDNFKEILDQMAEKESPELVAAMLEIFKRRIPSDIEELKSSLKEKNYDTLRSKAHLLAGSLSSLDFRKGYDLAKSVESAAKEINLDELNNLVPLFVKYITNSLNVIKSY